MSAAAWPRVPSLPRRQLLCGGGEQALDPAFERPLCGFKRFQTGFVMRQPLLVQPVYPGDVTEPCLAPLRQFHLPGGAVDKIAPLVTPTPRQNHTTRELAGQLLVGAIAVADQNGIGSGLAE